MHVVRRVYYAAVVSWRTYLRERNRDGRGWGAELTPRNTHESVIVSMT